MPSNLVVYNLGVLGVNIVDGPIQVRDGELLSSQNATVKTHERQQTLAKRDGMSRLNETTASGAILALTSVPFPDPGGYPVAGDALFLASNSFQRSTDGTNFSAVPATPVSSGFVTHRMVQGLNGWLYWVANSGIRAWNGTTETGLPSFGVGGPFGEVHYAPEAQLLYSRDNDGTIYIWDGSAWTITDAAVSAFHFAVTRDNVLFVNNGIDEEIDRWDGSAWVPDLDYGAALLFQDGIDSLSSYGDGGLVVAGGSSNALQVYYRDSGGAWTDITPFPTTYLGAFAFSVGDTLFLSYLEDIGQPLQLLEWDGSAWTTAIADVEALTGQSGAICGVVERGGVVYACQNNAGSPSGVIKRVSGVWSAVAGVTGYGIALGP